jgi:hypothetical protein
MNTPITREKSSQSGRIYFGALRDEKNRRFVSCACNGEVA